MKILYGVQGTGNGHMARANAMMEAFLEYPEVEVTWLVSGCLPGTGVELSENCMWRTGLTLATGNGKVNYLKTLATNKFRRFIGDLRSLRVETYDCVVTDYEPIVAWAARRQNMPVTGIGHQYAFEYAVPKAGMNFINRTVMKNFAPVTRSVGLHWHHFEEPVLPPILDLSDYCRQKVVANKVVVYLPFENLDQVLQLLGSLDSHTFYVYGPTCEDQDIGHIHTRALSRHGFKRDLMNTRSVICNSGFELISECLALGVRVLTKPLAGQPEQLSNALALQQLDYVTVQTQLTPGAVAAWLEAEDWVRVGFPEVHRALAAWLVGGEQQPYGELVAQLWDHVTVQRG